MLVPVTVNKKGTEAPVRRRPEAPGLRRQGGQLQPLLERKQHPLLLSRWGQPSFRGEKEQDAWAISPAFTVFPPSVSLFDAVVDNQSKLVYNPYNRIHCNM